MFKTIAWLSLFLALTLSVSLLHAQDAASDYVVATHYPAFGDTQPAPRDEVVASYEVYNNRLNDYYAVDASTAEDIADEIAGSIFREVRLVNDWADVEEDSNALQIVNNVPIEGALYTLFLPAGWNRSKDLPVVLSGNGAGTSNNRRLYGGETDMGIIIGLSTTVGDGLIGAMSNCGGTESQGVDETTYRSVGAFFEFIDENGGDKNNAMTAGWSRGGGSALMWAINPLGLDYNVHTVFAGVPPVRYGALNNESVLTYPSMGSIGVLISGDENGYRYDNPGWHSGMTPSPFLELIMGTGDPEEADALGPWGMAEGLRGKRVMLEAGSHDAFFSLRFVLEYDRLLNEMDIAHGTVITLNSGHEDTDYMRAELLNALLAMASGETDFETPTGRFYYIDNNPLEDEEMSLAEFYEANGIHDDPTQLPVTVELPFRAGVGNPVDLVICGTPGDEVQLSLGDIYSVAVTLDENECYHEQTAFDAAPGFYTWSLVVNGGDPISTAPGFTSPDYPVDDMYSGVPAGCGLVAATRIEEDQPLWSDSYATRRTMSFGILQYVPPIPEGGCVVG
ncbi:MAG: hypothetical protein U0694_10775 [Anaerolineae bacterium]